jgi:4-aminobutyrate aminotransferase
MDADVTPHYLSSVWTHLTRTPMVRGSGCWLTDANDERWLDLTSGIGVLNTGHCHPKVVSAVRQQLDQLVFSQINCGVPLVTAALAERLHAITPASINRFFFANSGAEATEAAIKLAKHATGRPNVIVLQGSFHGRTHLTMAMTTSKKVYRQGYQPLPAGVFVTPFPDPRLFDGDEDRAVAWATCQFSDLLAAQSAPSETAAFIVEPVLGEGGYKRVPTAFLRAVREICRAHGILFIADEVQSGFGRTGTFFCFEQADIDPDVIVMAKGLGSGMPISAVGASNNLMEHWIPGTHGGTYGGGNALAMASARATIDVIEEERLCDRAQQLGAYLVSALQHRLGGRPGVAEVRGLGLMVAIECEPAEGLTATAIASSLQQALLKARILVLTCGTYGHVLRLIPPLVVTQEELDLALDVLVHALASIH